MKVVIDGNIGSGKTTQLDLLEKKGWTVRREPIDQWPLEAFYDDPKRWAFYFHMVILQTLRPLKTSHPVVYERSLLSSRHVFWPIMLRKDLVTPEEDATYSKFYEQYSWYPDLYIFLSKSPDVAWKHVQSRGQAGDSGVTLDYLKELDQEYRELVRKVPCRVHVVNAERPVEEIHKQICEILADELLIRNQDRDEVQTESGRGREVSCTPFTDMCRMS